MKHRGVRLAGSIAAALALPFPGPHVDSWTPMAAVLLNEDARNAPPAFFLIAGALLAIYTGVAFGVLTLLNWVRTRYLP